MCILRAFLLFLSLKIIINTQPLLLLLLPVHFLYSEAIKQKQGYYCCFSKPLVWKFSTVNKKKSLSKHAFRWCVWKEIKDILVFVSVPHPRKHFSRPTHPDSSDRLCRTHIAALFYPLQVGVPLQLVRQELLWIQYMQRPSEYPQRYSQLLW